MCLPAAGAGEHVRTCASDEPPNAMNAHTLRLQKLRIVETLLKRETLNKLSLNKRLNSTCRWNSAAVCALSSSGKLRCTHTSVTPPGFVRSCRPLCSPPKKVVFQYFGFRQTTTEELQNLLEPGSAATEIAQRSRFNWSNCLLCCAAISLIQPNKFGLSRVSVWIIHWIPA